MEPPFKKQYFGYIHFLFSLFFSFFHPPSPPSFCQITCFFLAGCAALSSQLCLDYQKQSQCYQGFQIEDLLFFLCSTSFGMACLWHLSGRRRENVLREHDPVKLAQPLPHHSSYFRFVERAGILLVETKQQEHTHLKAEALLFPKQPLGMLLS